MSTETRRSWSIVVPTIGRPSLWALLDSSAASPSPGSPCPAVVVVDDRPALDELGRRTRRPGTGVTVLHSGGRGPAAARNVGWRATATDWVAFLDDDVVVSENWLADLAADLDQPAPGGRRSGPDHRAVAGGPPPHRLGAGHRRAGDGAVDHRGHGVPRRRPAPGRRVRRAVSPGLPRGRRPGAAGLDAGYGLVQGERRTTHPVRPAGWWASLRQQRGNADDVLMGRVHGRDWRRRAEAPLGRRPSTC